jgi:hypothetical protein
MINRHVVMIDNHGGGARGGAVISAGDSGQRSKNGEPLTRLSATLSPGGEGFIWLTAYPVEYRIPSSSGSCPNNHAQYWEKTGAQFETEGSPCSFFQTRTDQKGLTSQRSRAFLFLARTPKNHPRLRGARERTIPIQSPFFRRADSPNQNRQSPSPANSECPGCGGVLPSLAGRTPANPQTLFHSMRAQTVRFRRQINVKYAKD